MLPFLAAALWMSVIPTTPADDGRSLVEVGWEDRFSNSEAWRLEPWLVHSPDHQPGAEFGDRGGVFSISAAGKAMAWTRTTCPVWVEAFPWLAVDYTLQGQEPEVVIMLSDDSTGPITPGALNPENPLASGGRTRIDLPATGGLHLVDLTGLLKSDRVARVSILLRGTRGPATLRLRRIAFLAADPRATSTGPAATPATAWPPASPAASRVAAGDWLPIGLAAGQPVNQDWLSRALGQRCSWSDERVFEQGGAQFRLGSAGRAAVATAVDASHSLVLDGHWRGCELALLLATRVFGTGSPWPGTGSVRSRGPIVSPHELVVHSYYDDGSRRSAMPWSLTRRESSVQMAPEAYVVPLDPDHTLTRIEIEDRMTAGQVFLLAASVRPPDHPALHPVDAAPAGRPLNLPVPATTETSARFEAGTLIMRNAWLNLVADVQAGLSIRRLEIVPLQREVIASSASPAALLEIRDDKGQLLALHYRGGRISRREAGTVIELTWATDDADGGFVVNLRLEATDDGWIRLTPALSSPVAPPGHLTVCCPRLAGCRIAARPEERWYLLGTRSTVLDHRPVRVDQLYGGAFPLQLMDLFSPTDGGGIGLTIEDVSLLPKTFHFSQDADATAMSVEYPRVTVQASKKVIFPPCILFAHLGDWHDAYGVYRHSIRALVENRRAGGLGSLFYCRRDYPLGGTDYLFDVQASSYKTQSLVNESVRCFGGVDMIDISGWAYHEKTGRVGEYRTNDLGGLATLGEAIEAAHQRGVKVGLYFEGYLIDRRAPLAARALPAWQILDARHKLMWWPGEMEFYACPGVAAWRHELSQAIADVAAETGADAVYVDEFGFADAAKACWSSEHGHSVPSNPLVEEQAMLAEIRAALDRRTPRTAVYVEQLPCDATMGLVDGAFDYGMSGDDSARHVARLPLSRFVFPEVVPIEMVSQGIRPVPVTEDDLHRCLFHGLAFWLKGRGDSWYAPGFLETARRARRILSDRAATFRSPDCEPLVPTLVEGVYANRFATLSETILTVYNGRYTDVKGDLLRLPSPCQVRSLWSGRAVAHQDEGGSWVLRGQVAPRSVEVFLLSP
ncbi:MAG TPA: DUF6259 domain-containing protein [Phycisphaerae bacterium]|nr:DUF6259 domain-containing protein [Phycisphaerae bacterium]HRY69619.1 DUF6259 domain-containing protein [Phycisphaerae bacterium]HSA27266.1 DUF6259 domain-containing protein [Phycisphaerae bacterium]